MPLKLIALIALTLLLLLAIMQNSAPVEVQFLFATLTMPRAFLIALSALIGFGCGILATLWVGRKSKRPRG